MPEYHNEVGKLSSFPRVTLGGLTERSLASYQMEQVGNNCAVHSISTSFWLLSGWELSPSELAEELDNLPFLPRLPFRMWRDGPISPMQQVHLVHTLAKGAHLHIKAHLTHPGPADLVELIRKPDTAVLVTIGWRRGHAPVISLGENTTSEADNTHSLWHTMIAAAHDPLHRDSAGTPKPWGLINSWVNGGEALYWMPDADFKRAWSCFTPFGGIRPAVVIEK